jgi:Pyridoxamine 5'-phosphate oxidase
MGKVYDAIDEKLSAWLSAQKIFFVATAPLSQQGHVNCSPKDGRSFQILDQRTVVYLDLTGSGVETIAHVKENGRIVLMFCAFSGAPNIARMRGQGEVIESIPWRFALQRFRKYRCPSQSERRRNRGLGHSETTPKRSWRRPARA